MVILELTVDVTDLQNASSICAGCIMHTGQTDDALGMQIGRLLGMLKAACPEAAFLLTTPPGAYVGRRRARTINPRTVTAARIIKEYAQENKMAVWDMYNIVGGKTDACRNWTKHHMLRADGIHFTPDGYRLQGNLLHQALIKAYNEYVATGLE